MLQVLLYTNKRGRAPQRMQQLRDQLKAAGCTLVAGPDISMEKVEAALSQWAVGDDEALSPLVGSLKVRS